MTAFAIVLAWFTVWPLCAYAQGTPVEAKALAERAAAHMLEVGPEQALRDFNDPDGTFRDRDLFVVTYDPERKVASAIGVKAYLGRDATGFVDADGKEFGKEIIATAEKSGTGWVEYRMTNPITMKVELKTSYVIKVGDYIVFVGAYRP
jgi:hypothetical protein